jgi:hypothetical protein
MVEEKEMSDQSAASQILDRATRDPAFRQELGVSIPKSIEIRVVEESPSTLYLVSPPQPIAAGQELSDQELEKVAGGHGASLASHLAQCC